MKKIGWVKKDADAARSTILHFMKVKGCSVQVAPPDEADVLIVNDESASLDNHLIDAKDWVVYFAEEAGMDGNRITLPAGYSGNLLGKALEDILFNRVDQLLSACCPPTAPDSSDTAPKEDAVAPLEDSNPGAAPESATNAEEPDSHVGDPEASSIASDAEHPIEHDSPAETLSVEPQGSDSVAPIEDPSSNAVLARFDPDDFPLLNYLVQGRTSNIAISFDPKRSLRIYQEVALHNISKTALKAFALSKDSGSWTVEPLNRVHSPSNFEDDIQSREYHAVPLEKLLWEVCSLVSSGRLSSRINPAQEYSLSHYPDFNRIEASDDIIAVTSMLHRGNQSLYQLSKATGKDSSVVADILFALDVGGYLGKPAGDKLAVDNANTGIIRKLMSRFSLTKGRDA